jgi:hypothetical protein
VEPPTAGQVERAVASGCHRFDEAFAEAVAGRLGPAVCGWLEELLSRPNVLAELKSDAGPLGLDTLLAEIDKRRTSRSAGRRRGTRRWPRCVGPGRPGWSTAWSSC